MQFLFVAGRSSSLVSRAASLLIGGIVLSAVCILALPRVVLSESGADHAVNAPTSASSNLGAPGTAGQRIDVDPRTGARVPPSAPIPGVAADPAFSTSHAGLFEEPAPGGGMMIHLQGRFRSAATATVGADGKAAVDCVQPGTAAHQK